MEAQCMSLRLSPIDAETPPESDLHLIVAKTEKPVTTMIFADRNGLWGGCTMVT